MKILNKLKIIDKAHLDKYLVVFLVSVFYALLFFVVDGEGLILLFTCLLILTLFVLLILFKLMGYYDILLKQITKLRTDGEYLSQNQKKVYDLLVRHNDALITVSQHRATEQINFENNLSKKLDGIDLIVNLVDERTKIIKTQVGGD